jgi:lysophospholipase L1-like esterase
MKYLAPVASLVFLVLLALPGCGETKTTPATATIDTAKLQTSFETAPAETKAPVTKAIEAVKAGNFQAALTELTPLVTNLKLTPEQKTAVQDMITKVKEKIAAAAKEVIPALPKTPEVPKAPELPK